MAKSEWKEDIDLVFLGVWKDDKKTELLKDENTEKFP